VATETPRPKVSGGGDTPTGGRMWIINRDGFYAAIRHYDDPEKVVVRGRSREDMFRLQDTYMTLDCVQDSPTLKMDGPPRIEETLERDYTYRIEMLRVAWAEYISGDARTINYGDFKAEMARQGFNKRQQDCLLNVWIDMLDWTDQIFFLEPEEEE